MKKHITGGPSVVRFCGPGKNRIPRNSYLQKLYYRATFIPDSRVGQIECLDCYEQLCAEYFT